MKLIVVFRNFADAPESTFPSAQLRLSLQSSYLQHVSTYVIGM